MITFRVAKEPYGWAVEMNRQMKTPFRQRELAVREAEKLATALRRHGQLTEVVVEDDHVDERRLNGSLSIQVTSIVVEKAQYS